MIKQQNIRITSRIILALLILASLLLMAGQPQQVQASTCTMYHTVSWGENLYRIGLRYGVSWTTLMAWNNLYTTWIFPGQVLCVAKGGVTPPPNPTCRQYYTVQWGDNLFRIGLRYGVSWISLMYWNSIYNPHWIYPGQVLCVSYY